jgi:hypothetical protein
MQASPRGLRVFQGGSLALSSKAEARLLAGKLEALLGAAAYLFLFGLNGLITATSKRWKSRSFRVATVSP